MSRKAFSKQDQYERDLCKIIQLITFYEEQLEDLRQSLGECSKFNAALLFWKISQGANYIDKNLFRCFFAENHVPMLEKDCDYLVFEFGGAANNRLKIEDFIRPFISLRNHYLKTKIEEQFQAFLEQGQQPPSQVLDLTDIPYFIQQLVVKFFQLVLRRFKELESAKTLFTSQYGTHLLKAFQNISDKGHTLEVVLGLMKRNGFSFSQEQYQCLMSRIDKDKNGEVSKEEFLDENFILPCYQFSSYAKKQQKVISKNLNQFTSKRLGQFYHSAGKVYELSVGNQNLLKNQSDSPIVKENDLMKQRSLEYEQKQLQSQQQQLQEQNRLNQILLPSNYIQEQAPNNQQQYYYFNQPNKNSGSSFIDNFLFQNQKKRYINQFANTSSSSELNSLQQQQQQQQLQSSNPQLRNSNSNNLSRSPQEYPKQQQQQNPLTNENQMALFQMENPNLKSDDQMKRQNKNLSVIKESNIYNSNSDGKYSVDPADFNDQYNQINQVYSNHPYQANMAQLSQKKQ